MGVTPSLLENLPNENVFNDDDTLWERKLPPHYEKILAKAVSPVISRSKKEFYNKLCKSILIERGTQSIWLDKSTDKIGIMVSAKALDITGGLDSRYWQWVSSKDSRFEQVAELKQVPRFEVWQRIECTLLSPNTNYTVSFVLQINKEILGSCPTPFDFSLKPIEGDLKESAIFLDDFNKQVEKEKTGSRPAENGWIEFDVGEFNSKDDTNSGETREIEVSMRNIESNFIKKGIVIDGLKINPKRQPSTA